LAQVRAEADQVREFARLAKEIIKNSKGEVLLKALREGFEAAAKAQKRNKAAVLQQKAIIFTESRRTQAYLFDILQATEFKDRSVLFNGTNGDERSKGIYRAWLVRHEGTDRISGSPSADMRAALVEEFRDRAAIMIATEAAAEGVNLQFCNLVVNYDMPWNPQRIEQRIGRCHRYGQKYDVVVVNFLNKANAADVRVYQLLDEKFKLFDGIFGASDEVLGAVESGLDFEKRIAAIYQKCRTPEQIAFEFDELRTELETEIAERQTATREELLNNFDQEVVEKVRVESKATLDRYNERLWKLTRLILADDADFRDGDHSFTLRRNPLAGEAIHTGPYRLAKDVTDANTYRVGHPLARHVLERAQAGAVPIAEVTFALSTARTKISALLPVATSSGWLTLRRLSSSGLETEDELVFAAVTDDGEELDAEQCRRLFDLPGAISAPAELDDATAALGEAWERAKRETLGTVDRRSAAWFDDEMQKLERWAEDFRVIHKRALDETEKALRDAKSAARSAPTLPEKLERQREARALEAKRDEAWRAYDRAGRDLDTKKETLLDDVARRIEQATKETELFTIRWKIA
jgi:hypothetical protein